MLKGLVRLNFSPAEPGKVADFGHPWKKSGRKPRENCFERYSRLESRVIGPIFGAGTFAVYSPRESASQGRVGVGSPDGEYEKVV